MSDKTFSRLKQHYNEIYSIEPNNLHASWLNNIFKMVSRYMKVFPFRVFVPASVVAALVMYIIFGILVIKLVSLLQYGF